MIFNLKAIILSLYCLMVCTQTAYSHQTTFKHHTSGYVKVKQGQLFYQRYGTGTPIIILHGGPGLDQGYLQPQLLALAANHTVIFYDQRGSGKSLETQLTTDYININQFTDDLEALRTQLGLNNIILLGHSWGGFLAMNYTIHYPKNISKLILLSSAPASFKGQQAFLNEFAKRTETIKKEIVPLFNDQSFAQLNSEQLSRLYQTLFSVYCYNPKDAAKLTLKMNEKSAQSGQQVMALMAQTSSITANTNLLSLLEKLQIPTLLIHGEDDIVPLWTAHEIKQAIPHAQIAILKQCGHFPYIEQPKLLFSHIRHFLNHTNHEKFN